MANSTPPELLEQICQCLATPELKTARLICRSFSPVARKHLFEEVLLKSNLASYRKLSYISRHPVLSHFVYKVLFDGTLLSDRFEDYDEWLRYDGNSSKDGHLSAKNEGAFRDHFMPAELKYHYSQYRYHIESQRFAQAESNEADWLLDACKSFQNLEAIAYVSGQKATTERVIRIQKPLLTRKTLSAIGQETLVEPDAYASPHECALKFKALLEAAHASCGRLKNIEGIGIPYETFDMLGISPAVNEEDMRTVRHLNLYVACDRQRDRRTEYLAKFLANALMLQSLQLSFDRQTSFAFQGQNVKLSELLVDRIHWPSLNKLHLATIETSEADLKDFLETHSSTLRSLELCNITLRKWPPSGHGKGDSWVTLIQFLSESLSLKHVSLDGELTSPAEGWATYDRDHWEHEFHTPQGISMMKFNWNTSLRCKINSYILRGGECPLGVPQSHNSYSDISWTFREDLIVPT
ncbi:hypothetical protein MMC28_003438 [Mycoblastus sanguinarius]|nr:hypothetical protein [Mycoblastus sanguinarius]